MTDNRLRDTPEQPSLQSRITVRPENEQIRLPVRRFVHDHGSWIAVPYDGLGRESLDRQRTSDSLGQTVSFGGSLLLELLQDCGAAPLAPRL